jgi:hypothetical protein
LQGVTTHNPLANKGSVSDAGGVKTTFTDEDFDALSWHDCHVHGIELRTGHWGDGDWTSELALDIDFIVGGSCAIGREVVVLVAPATLVFHDATALRIGITWAPRGSGRPLEPASISHIERHPPDGAQASGKKAYEWTIAFNWPDGGVIEFGATRFSQQLRSEPVDAGSAQHLSTAQRRDL